ncbi:RNA-binding protein 26 isoform X1 [Callorhinchus milii]|uniref:RNA-binding protein 26 isoform X1 n=1 Tax=Callorhinchus milii TaxID=7868 RepID=UPI00045726EA|nr:RNA-binding protein 26 isoform X1 [Callorhinchus milii]|eukprot:gi/632968853/ref/XP_007900760.1/ PREDICTED: RNA-binding protein 26 isoform X2 [Callorhinchus milii]
MMIENLEALKSWLSKTLEPICDADPSALAKYVVALVKKDKTEKELKALCVDQLDVFLQKDTHTFVEKLFEAINTKSYLPQLEQLSSVNIKLELPQRQEREDKKEEGSKDDDERDKKFSRRLNHSPQQSGSRYRDNRNRDDRKKDDRSRKREYDRYPPRRDSYRDRYNRRRGRSRSYSRSRSRSWSKERNRDRSRSRSRERDSVKLKFDLDRTESSESNFAPNTPVSNLASGHYPVPTLSSAITVIAPAHHGNTTTENWTEYHEEQLDHNAYVRAPPPKKRCRDYDEKGFCMRGDMCPFDHGSDPVVVEDVNLPGILPFPSQPPVVEGPNPPVLPPPPPILTPPPVNLRPPVPPPGPLPPSLPPVAGPPPPLPPLQPLGMDVPPSSITSSVPAVVTSVIHHQPPSAQPPPYTAESYEPDGYNPEAPSITSTSRPVYRHRVHSQRPNLIGLTSGDMDLPPRAANITVKTEKIANNNMRIVVDSESRKRTIGGCPEGIPLKKQWFDKTNFNKLNNQGFQKKALYGNENAKLELRKVPQELNNISKLNEHFSKFGTIVNLQVAYQGDPEGALIQFATHDEAKRAISSTEAVLNNRFIKVYWHRESNSQQKTIQNQKVLSGPQQSATQSAFTVVKQSVKDRLGPLPPGNMESMPSQVTATVQNVNKLSIKDRLGFPTKRTELAPVTTEKVLSTTTGLTKTVYNPDALKAAQKSLATSVSSDPNEAQKKKQDAFRLQQDVRKKKQEILEKHIETQKILISKLEKNKTIKPEDKAEIMKTLQALTKSITKLQDELKANRTGSSPLPKTVKTKAQMQKELLDTELDLHKKTQAGEDVAELRKKYNELQLEAAKRGILSAGRGRGVHCRGRGGQRGRGRGRGRSVSLHSVVDHRPKSLNISGFSESDQDEILPHFAQFGEIEDCQIPDGTLHAVITFKRRAEAETAALHGNRFKGQNLQLAWYKPGATTTAAETEDTELDEEEFQEESLIDDLLLQDDDEEEDDNESRSWRR